MSKYMMLAFMPTSHATSTKNLFVLVSSILVCVFEPFQFHRQHPHHVLLGKRFRLRHAEQFRKVSDDGFGSAVPYFHHVVSVFRMAGRRLAALVVVASVALASAGMAVPVPLGIAVASPAVVRPYTPAVVVEPAPVAG